MCSAGSAKRPGADRVWLRGRHRWVGDVHGMSGPAGCTTQTAQHPGNSNQQRSSIMIRVRGDEPTNVQHVQLGRRLRRASSRNLVGALLACPRCLPSALADVEEDARCCADELLPKVAVHKPWQFSPPCMGGKVQHAEIMSIAGASFSLAVAEGKRSQPRRDRGGHARRIRELR